jgi:hypothetical protein
MYLEKKRTMPESAMGHFSDRQNVVGFFRHQTLDIFRV